MKHKLYLPTNTYGFTLIELMVAITIIAILMIAGVVALTNTQKKSRDARRRADVRVLSQAMESYYMGGTFAYPTSGYAAALTSSFPAGLPTDSQGTAYTITSTATKYCICADLEISDGNASSLGSGGTCAFLPSSTGGFYCAAQQQ
jgi:prepilin-type N-terminal cleavage/methylation domain-containing protein